MANIDHRVESGFKRIFPVHARKVQEATSEQARELLHEKLIVDCEKAIDAAVAAEGPLMATGGRASENASAMLLSHGLYQSFLQADGELIKNRLAVLIAGIEKLEATAHNQPAIAARNLLAGGLLALGFTSTSAVGIAAAKGTSVAVAVANGVAATSPLVLCAIALLVIAVLYGILYGLEKPAACIILLINELDSDLVFRDHANVHGKPDMIPPIIPAAVAFDGEGLSPGAGLIATRKKDFAARGTQYGFVMGYKKLALAFAVQCPLTDIGGILGGKNACYCAFDEKPLVAANAVKSSKLDFALAAKADIGLSIRCHSPQGSIAYFIARAFRR